ncbi:D-alanyl-D-alanine carboxypeptidase DacA precursor, partial [Haemophilus influenzae]
RSKSIFFRA